MAEVWNLRRVLEWTTRDFVARGIGTARLDAELLVAHALGIDRVKLYMDLDRPLDVAELAAARELVRRRRAREPVAYILGFREFYGRTFEVGPAVLVPRPETETLVEQALKRLDGVGEGRRALDIGTGSGIVAVSLAAEKVALRVDAVDLSPEAIEVARANAERHGVLGRVTFVEGDLFSPVDGTGVYDVIVSNPPYIPTGEIGSLQPDVSRHEPRLALDGGADGLEVIRRLTAEAARRMRSGGALLVEIGAGQADRVVAMIAATGAFEPAAVHRDLAGIERVVEARGT